MRFTTDNALDSLHPRESRWSEAEETGGRRGTGQKPGRGTDVQSSDFMIMSSSEAVEARLRILHLEANAKDATLIHDALASAGISCEIEWVQWRRDFEAALGRGHYDLVLSNESAPSLDGLSALQMAR